MIIISDTLDFNITEPTAVAIGKFDGIHVGHRKLLQEILEKKKEGLKACVLTFNPSLASFFGWSDQKELTTIEEKRYLFEKMGIDILIEFPVNKENVGMEPEIFARDLLAHRMHAKYIVAGNDLSFGRGGAGNAALLESMTEELGFCVKTIDKVCIDRIEVSSTYARGLLEEGKMEKLAEMLGMPYMAFGEVVYGKQLGRTIGFPTVNILPPSSKLMPPFGVYYSKVKVREKEYRAISNVGYKPTVTDEKICGIESYLYDFDEQIYGENIEVSLLSFKRPEQRFDGLEALQAQLQEDIAAGAKYGIE